MKINQISVFDYEHELNSLFRYYPADLIEAALIPLLPKATDGVNEHTNITHLFYEELNAVIQRCLSSYHQIHSTNAEPTVLKNITTLIKTLIALIPAGYIFCNNTSKGNYSLTLVLDQYLYQPFNEVQDLVNFTLLAHPEVTCSAHTYGTMAQLIHNGHFYYSTLCRPTNCVYQRTHTFTLPQPDPILLAETRYHSLTAFKQNSHKADSFFNGAKRFLQQNENAMAAFMLQQACEFSFRSLIVAFKGKDIKSHDLLALRKHALPYAPGLLGLFHSNERKEQHILLKIQEAYIKSRYDTTYQIDTYELMELITAATNFMQGVKQIFEMQYLRNEEL